MDIISIIIVSFVAVCAAIGLLTGAFKGLTGVKSYAVGYALTALIVTAAGNLIIVKKGSGIISAVIIYALALVLLVAFAAVFALLRRLFSKRVQNGVGWKVADKIIGAITAAITGAVIAGAISAVALTLLDLTRLAAEGGSLNGIFGALYSGEGWNFFKNYLFDFFIIGIIALCVKCGFNDGITSALWSLIVVLMIGGAAYLSWHLAFRTEPFIAVAEKLDANLSTALSGFSELLESINLTTLTISKGIITLALFILSLIIVIALAVLVPKALLKAREGRVFAAIDGVFGAIVLTVIIMAIAFVLGAVANSLYEMDFMANFNSYFAKSTVATFVYDRNVLNAFGLLTDLPIADWFR